MENPAKTAHPIHDLLARRWSPRAFSDKPVEKEKLLALFEAARWAASSYGEEPWSYIVARKRQDMDAFDRLRGCLVEFNQSWAQHAPVLAISVARLTFARNGKPNPHAWHDTGAASASLCVQATALGLVVHQMAGFDPVVARQTLNIPAEFEPVAAMAIGYPGDPEKLSEKLREREMAPRTRKPIEDFLYTFVWGRKASFL